MDSVHQRKPSERHAASPGIGDDVIVLSSSMAHQRRQTTEAAVAAVEPPERLFYKTRLCEKFTSTGQCPYDGNCTFAHGMHELRPPPPGWQERQRLFYSNAARSHPHGGAGGFHGPPTAAAAPPPRHGRMVGKDCFEYRDTGTCRYGDRCNYSHAFAGTRHPGGPMDSQRNAAVPPFPSAPVAVHIQQQPKNASPEPPPAAAVRDDGRSAAGALLTLRGRKVNGIYGDWPEED